MRNIPLYLSLLLLLTCAKEDNSPPPQIAKQYTLSVNAGEGGSVTVFIPSSSYIEGSPYEEGTQVMITATPDTGYVFNGWSNGSSEESITLTINQAINITANFIMLSSDVTFKNPEGGYFELKNLESSEVYVIVKDTIVNIPGYNNYIINAIPNEGFHFDGWVDPVLDTIQMIPVLNLQSLNLPINSSIEVESRFISKIPTGKSIIPAHNHGANYLNITDDMLNYRASENFIVWWDKDWFHNNDAKELLYWAEFTYSKGIEYGMRFINEAARTNIYIHHVSDENGDNEDVFSDGWGQAAGYGANSNGFYSVVWHPYFTFNSIKKGEEYDLSNSELIQINPLYPKLNVHHEVFHVMQQYAFRNGNFAYGGEHGWYAEATAEWFELKYRPSPDVWRHAPSYLLNPYLRLWDFTQGNLPLDQHRYGASLLLSYLEWNNIVEESFFGQSYYSGTNLTPQEYLSNNIPDFKNHFIDFAGNASVIDFGNSSEQIKERKQIYISDWSDGIDTQFELVLNNEGTDGIYTPQRKIESWAYQTIKLISENESNYTYKFNSILLGSEGGVADFNLIIVKEKNGEFTYEKKYIADDSIMFDFTAESNANYYFTIVNTPEKFVGSDYYSYNIEIEKL